MIKLLTLTASVALIVVGLIVLPMPIPLGGIMIVSGIVLLVSVSAVVALWVKAFRRRHGRTNRMIQNIEDRLPEAWKKILRRTDP